MLKDKLIMSNPKYLRIREVKIDMINLEQYLISEDEIATEGIKDFFKKIGNKLDNAAKNNYRKRMNRMMQTNFPEVYREELERRTKFMNLVGKATDALASVLGGRIYSSSSF